MEQKPPHPLDIIIGSQLRLRRKMMGMSQVLLAQRVGITFQQIQKYELGRNSISARRLFELAQLLGVSPMYFYDAYADSVTVMPDALTTQAIHLVQDYTSIPSITNWPARVSAQMAAELGADPHTTHVTLKTYVRQHLSELAEFRASLD